MAKAQVRSGCAARNAPDLSHMPISDRIALLRDGDNLVRCARGDRLCQLPFGRPPASSEPFRVWYRYSLKAGYAVMQDQQVCRKVYRRDGSVYTYRFVTLKIGQDRAL
jgi:hypothetical protein